MWRRPDLSGVTLAHVDIGPLHQITQTQRCSSTGPSSENPTIGGFLPPPPGNTCSYMMCSITAFQGMTIPLDGLLTLVHIYLPPHHILPTGTPLLSAGACVRRSLCPQVPLFAGASIGRCFCSWALLSVGACVHKCSLLVLASCVCKRLHP